MTNNELTQETQQAQNISQETPQDNAESENSDEQRDVIGQVVDGTVTHITTFGAFVKLDNGEEGLVHISEIANEYVTEITAFVNIGEKIQVKVLNRNVKGKLDLSIKKVHETEKPALFLRRKTRNDDFESKISLFLKKSEEKQIDIRRNLKHKQGIIKRKK
jgi:S1 RNA binding domain protein